MPGKALVAASLKPLVLSVLARGPSYGYDIIQQVQALSDGKILWTAGTLYPLLHRLETQGLVQTEWQPSEDGPRRKYYTLTPAGEQAMAQEQQEWMEVHATLLKLWQPGLALE